MTDQKQSLVNAMLAKMPRLGQRATTEDKTARLMEEVRSADRVAKAKAVYAGDVTEFDLTCIVPVLHGALAADAEQGRRDAFEMTVGDRFE